MSKQKRLANPSNPIEVPFKANIERAMDFVSDALSNGKKIPTFNIAKFSINYTTLQLERKQATFKYY